MAGEDHGLSLDLACFVMAGGGQGLCFRPGLLCDGGRGAMVCLIDLACFEKDDFAYIQL